MGRTAQPYFLSAIIVHDVVLCGYLSVFKEFINLVHKGGIFAIIGGKLVQEQGFTV